MICLHDRSLTFYCTLLLYPISFGPQHSSDISSPSLVVGLLSDLSPRLINDTPQRDLGHRLHLHIFIAISFSFLLAQKQGEHCHCFGSLRTAEHTD